jgi:glycosyltransferase involved in cell wall biosynthesis
MNQYMAEHRPYLHISWRHNIKVTDAPTFAWCHDLITPGIEASANRVKAICLTPFHADFMHNMQLVPYEEIFISRNGIKPERFLGERPKKNPNKIVFPSSPDRGLDRAILIMDEVRKEFPDAELHVFYGIEHLPQWGHKPLHDRLVAMFKERPWVKYHGKTEQSILTGHLKEAAVWLHPCDFIETSCITAMEMIASGVYPVTRRLGGLKDTLKSAEEQGLATILNHDCVTPEEFRNYITATLTALREKRWERKAFQSFNPRELAWENVAKEWLEELPKMAGIGPAVLGATPQPLKKETKWQTSPPMLSSSATL